MARLRYYPVCIRAPQQFHAAGLTMPIIGVEANNGTMTAGRPGGNRVASIGPIHDVYRSPSGVTASRRLVRGARYLAMGLGLGSLITCSEPAVLREPLAAPVMPPLAREPLPASAEPAGPSTIERDLSASTADAPSWTATTQTAVPAKPTHVAPEEQAFRPAAASPARPAPPAVTLTLPDAVLIGLRKNRAIQTEYLQRIADRFALYVAEQTFTPTVDINAAFTRSRSEGSTTNNINAAPDITWSLPTGATISGGLTTYQTTALGQNPALGPAGSAYSQLSLQVIQPLLRGAGTEAATANLRISRIEEKKNKLTLEQTVIDNVTAIITAYRALIDAQEQQHIAEDALQRAHLLLDTNRTLIAAGRLAAVELVQSQASIAEQELALATARNTTDTARLALLALLALDPASRIVTVDKLTTIPVQIDEAKALRIAYDRQPAYLSQLLTIESSKISLFTAKNQRLWDVSVILGAGQSANGTGIFQTLQAGNKPDYAAGVQLDIPLFNPALEQAEVNASVALRQAELQAEQLHDQTEQQVHNAVRTVEIQGSLLEIAKRARQLSAAQLDIELTKLQVGRSSNFEVVAFQNTLQQSESTELSAIVNYLNSLTTLDQVLGTTLESWQINLKDL